MKQKKHAMLSGTQLVLLAPIFPEQYPYSGVGRLRMPQLRSLFIAGELVSLEQSARELF
jgi:hypothetical protein